MPLTSDLEAMGKHLADKLEAARNDILLDEQPVFAKAVYGEPSVIANWPMASVQPLEKIRNLREGATRKFQIIFRIYVVLYHGKVADTLDIQSGAHKRAECIERYLHTDFRWNFVDADDHDLDQVIFGYVSVVDHPVVVAPGQELWSASRLELTGLSEEYF